MTNIKDRADSACSRCEGTGYISESIGMAVCECVFPGRGRRQKKCTYFQETGQWIDEKIDTVRSLFEFLSRLGFTDGAGS